MVENTQELQAGISAAQPHDCTRIVAVWESSVQATHNFISAADIDMFRPLVQGGLEALNVLCVRDLDGEVVGFMGVDGDEVAALFIDADWRGHGIGRRLMTYAIETLGATRVDVNEQNPQAIGFYERMGFEVVGRSDTDGLGKPYPLLHMRLKGE